jgi:predicted nuclease with RNAse H fold
MIKSRSTAALLGGRLAILRAVVRAEGGRGGAGRCCARPGMGGCAEGIPGLASSTSAQARASADGACLPRGGVDVGGRRKGFDVAVVDDRRILALQGRLTCQQVVDLTMANRPRVTAIDSPRSCAPPGQTARDGERQLFKSVCGIRWTPDESRVHASAYYAWIIEELALFDALATRGVEVIEVFPTASWTRWHGERGARTRSAWTRQGLEALGLDGVPPRTNQDQRDAIAAAVTARQHTLVMTDTMGDIVVPASHWRPAGPQAPVW